MAFPWAHYLGQTVIERANDAEVKCGTRSLAVVSRVMTAVAQTPLRHRWNEGVAERRGRTLTLIKTISSTLRALAEKYITYVAST